MSAGLVKYEAARVALAECKAVDEVKGWVDKAAAMQAYGRMAKDKSLEISAAEIRIRAERRLGELIRLQKETVGLNPGGRPTEETPRDERGVSPTEETPTLAEVGISHDLSSRSQKLAAVPEEEFEAEVEEWKDRVQQEGKRVTSRLESAGARAMARGPKTPVDDAPPAIQRIKELEAQLAAARATIEERDAELKELAAMLKETVTDNESMARILDAEDMKAAYDNEVKRFKELARVTEARNVSLTVEVNELKRFAKSWRRKYEKLAKITPAPEPEDQQADEAYPFLEEGA